jgi:hypothetical protein
VPGDAALFDNLRTVYNPPCSVQPRTGDQMGAFRVALANVRFPATPEESVRLAERAISEASRQRAGIICFPECFVPGYRAKTKRVPPSGLLVADVDLDAATGLLATRSRYS